MIPKFNVRRIKQRQLDNIRLAQLRSYVTSSRFHPSRQPVKSGDDSNKYLLTDDVFYRVITSDYGGIYPSHEKDISDFLHGAGISNFLIGWADYLSVESGEERVTEWREMILETPGFIGDMLEDAARDPEKLKGTRVNVTSTGGWENIFVKWSDNTQVVFSQIDPLVKVVKIKVAWTFDEGEPITMSGRPRDYDFYGSVVELDQKTVLTALIPIFQEHMTHGELNLMARLTPDETVETVNWDTDENILTREDLFLFVHNTLQPEDFIGTYEIRLDESKRRHRGRGWVIIEPMKNDEMLGIDFPVLIREMM